MSINRTIGVPAGILPALETIITKIRSPKDFSPRNDLTKIGFDPGSNRIIGVPTNIMVEETKQETKEPIAPSTIIQDSSFKLLEPSKPKKPIDRNLYSPLSKLVSPLNNINNDAPKISFRKINQTSLDHLTSKTHAEPDKKTGKNKVVHPIFEKALKFINDEFWINILVSSSQGKFKRGFSYRDHYLYYKNKEKIYIDQDDALKALNQLQFFMKTKAGIMSETDRLNEQHQVQQKMDQINEAKKYEWSDIKNNNFRTLLLERYIAKVIKFYGLSSDEILQLKTTLYFALILGELSHTIRLEDNNIIAITNLSFDQETRKFDVVAVGKRSSSKKSKSSLKEAKSNKYSLNKSFTELVKFLDKKRTRQLNENDKLESYMHSTMGSEESTSEEVCSSTRE